MVQETMGSMVANTNATNTGWQPRKPELNDMVLIIIGGQYYQITSNVYYSRKKFVVNRNGEKTVWWCTACRAEAEQLRAVPYEFEKVEGVSGVEMGELHVAQTSC